MMRNHTGYLLTYAKHPVWELPRWQRAAAVPRAAPPATSQPGCPQHQDGVSASWVTQR